MYTPLLTKKAIIFVCLITACILFLCNHVFFFHRGAIVMHTLPTKATWWFQFSWLQYQVSLFWCSPLCTLNKAINSGFMKLRIIPIIKQCMQHICYCGYFIFMCQSNYFSKIWLSVISIYVKYIVTFFCLQNNFCFTIC